MIRNTLLALLTIAFIACDITDGDRPFKSDSKIFKHPYITGKITNIRWQQIGQDSLLTILVKENPDANELPEQEHKKMNLSLWNSTDIFIQEQEGNTYHANQEDLKVDQKVSGWVRSGVILTSYPSQAGAKRILVIEE